MTTVNIHTDDELEVIGNGVTYVPGNLSGPETDPGLSPGYVSPHFRATEFACNHCGALSDPGKPSAPNAELLEVLEDVRQHFGGKPITINSAYRCKTHNDNVGSSDRSQHRTNPCCAADIRVYGIDPLDVYRYLDGKYPNTYGVGRYSSFTHIDTRFNRARW